MARKMNKKSKEESIIREGRSLIKGGTGVNKRW